MYNIMGNVFNLIIQSYNYFPLTELVSYPVYFFTAELWCRGRVIPC